MAKIRFRCIECGNEVEKDLLALGHAVRDFGRSLSDEKECCDNSYYIDNKGYCRVPRETSLIDRITSLRA